MLKIFRKNKTGKIIATAILLFAIFALTANTALAQQAQEEQEGFAAGAARWVVNAALGPAIKGIGGTVLTVVNGVLWIVRTILSMLLSIAAYLLNEAFKINVNTSPAEWSVVREGWSISRDIVNSLFILIVLWIAFTIIFGQEQYGGKALLVKVVGMALVINFSLVMVTAVFGFSNIFARIFADQLPKDVSGFIVNAIKAQTAAVGGDPSAEGSKQSAQEQTKDAKTKAMYNPSQHEWGVKNTLLASLGFNPVSALEEQAAADKGENAVAPKTGSEGNVREGFLDVVGKEPTSFFSGAVRDTQNNVMAILFLGITIVVLLIGAITLIIRLVFMIVLSIVAPLALLAGVVPVKSIQGFLKKWVGLLFNWAFFAPGFYFLFYMALFMLNQFDKISAGAGGAGAGTYLDFNRIIQLWLALGIMLMAVKFAKQTGGAISDAAIGMASKAAMVTAGVATGGATLAAGMAARGAAPQIQRAAGAISGVPGLGRIALPVTKRVSAFVKASQGKAEQKRTGLKDMDDDLVLQSMRGGASSRVAGALEMLNRPGGKNKLSEAGIDLAKILKDAGRFGDKSVMTILQARPDLASDSLGPNFTREKVIAKMKPDDIDKVDFDGILKADKTGQTLQLIMNEMVTNNGSTERFAKILSSMSTQSKGTRNALNNSMQGVLDNKPLWNKMETDDPELFKRQVKQIVVNQKTLGVTALNKPDHLVQKAKAMGMFKGQGRTTPSNTPPKQSPGPGEEGEQLNLPI